MTDCRVSLDELKYDTDNMDREGLDDSESRIGDFDDPEDLILAIRHVDYDLWREFAQKVRMRDKMVMGILPILKAEYLRQVETD
jgi:hypothetical protein